VNTHRQGLQHKIFQLYKIAVGETKYLILTMTDNFTASQDDNVMYSSRHKYYSKKEPVSLSICKS
jgi:hypothetical protein